MKKMQIGILSLMTVGLLAACGGDGGGMEEPMPEDPATEEPAPEDPAGGTEDPAGEDGAETP